MARRFEITDDEVAAAEQLAMSEHVEHVEHADWHKLRDQVLRTGWRIVEQDRELLDRLAR